MRICCLPRASPEHNVGDKCSTKRKANKNQEKWSCSKNRTRTTNMTDAS